MNKIKYLLFVILITASTGCGPKTITWGEMVKMSESRNLKVVSMEGEAMIVVDQATGEKYSVPYITMPQGESAEKFKKEH